MKKQVSAAIVGLLFIATVSSMTIDCSNYLEGLYDEQEIIEKFKGDINSGNLKSIHSK